MAPLPPLLLNIAFVATPAVIAAVTVSTVLILITGTGILNPANIILLLLWHSPRGGDGSKHTDPHPPTTYFPGSTYSARLAAFLLLSDLRFLATDARTAFNLHRYSR